MLFTYFRKARRQSLRDEQIITALWNGYDSEDGQDFDDDSIADPDFDPEQEDIDDVAENVGEDNDPDDDPDNDPDLVAPPEPLPSCSRVITPPIPLARRHKPDKLKLQWKKKNLELNAQQLAFTGMQLLDPEILELERPIQFVMYLFPEEVVARISAETKLYAV